MHNKKVLEEYLPLETIDDILHFLEKHKVVFKITKGRKTKLGDYRCPYKKDIAHQITINGNLSKFTFLLVCLHEFAHLNIWIKYKRNVLPHGKEWKDEFKRFVVYYLKENIFPSDLAIVLEKHMQNPSATLVTDKALLEKLQKYNSKNEEMDKVFLSDLVNGSVFELSNRTFQILEKQRTRYRCKSLSDERLYLVPGNALVKQVDK